MRNLRRKTRILIPATILIFALILGIIFISRSPVLIVTDSSFGQLYGSRRLWFRNIRTSLELFRRIIPVEVFENAGPDLVALAVVNISPSPRAVLFPYRYQEAALYYIDMYPEIPVYVTGGRMIPQDQSVAFVRTDTAVDLYRAGLYAALLAGEKGVLFASSDYIHDDYSDAFLLGLHDQGYERAPVLLNVSDSFSSFEEIGCIVIIGNAGRFIEQDSSIPVILFSWADPSFTPGNVKLMFDDSPWVMVREILGYDHQIPQEILVPSRPHLIAGRMENRFNYFGHSAILREKIQKNQEKTVLIE